MNTCLDCGYLWLPWNGAEDEFTESQRKELGQFLEEIATGKRALKNDPRYLRCYRNVASFPGRNHPIPSGHAISHNSKIRMSHIVEMKRSCEAIARDWDCECFAPHHPGLTAQQHIKFQKQQDWEEEQRAGNEAFQQEMLEH